MAINNLIAQGIAPIGRDLPDVANMLAQRRMQEQQNAIATQNAEQYRRSLDMQSQAREQEMAQRKAAEARGWIEANYDAIKARPDAMPKLLALAKQKQYLPPDFPDNATLEDVALHFGVQAPAAPVPFEQTPEGQKLKMQGDQAMALARFNKAADAALERLRQSAPEKAKGASWDKVEKPLPDGRIQIGFIDKNSPTPDATFRPFGAPTQRPEAAQKTASQQAVEQTYELYKTAKQGLLDGLEGSVTGPVMGRVPAVTAEQQIAEGGVAAMAPVLKQLFRVAGEGVFTDKDQELLLKMIPTRATQPRAREAQIKNIDNIVRAKLGIPPDAGDVPPDIAAILQKHGGK